jgi:hypothetical protein
VVRVALQFLEVERRVIVEALASGIVQDPVERVVVEPAALTPRTLRQDPGLGRREHAVEAAQHGHRQHDALVLRRPVRAAQQVSDLPDEVFEIVIVGHRWPHPAWLQRALGLARVWLRSRAWRRFPHCFRSASPSVVLLAMVDVILTSASGMHPCVGLRELALTGPPHPLSGLPLGLDPSVGRVLRTPRMNRNFKAYFPWRPPVAYSWDRHRERPLVYAETVPLASTRDIHGLAFQISIKIRGAGAAQPVSRAGVLA